MENIITKKRKEALLIKKEPPQTQEEIDFLNRIKKHLTNFENPTKDDLEYIQIIFSSIRQAELMDGAIPQNKEEEEWIKNYKEGIKKREEERRDYEKRVNLATKESIALAKKYSYNDYLPLGKFNNPIFMKKEKHIHEVIDEQFYEYIKKHKIKDNMIVNEVYLQLKIKAFKDIYNIDWKPFGYVMSEEFRKEYTKILKKYDLGGLDVLDFTK